MKNIKRAGLVTASATTLVVGGIAFAAWTSTGTATGTVTAGQQTALTGEDGANPVALFPTQSKDVTITFTNENSYPVLVKTISKGALGVVGGVGCTAGNSAVTFSDAPVGANDYLAAGATRAYTVTATMGADSADGCQNAAFSTEYTASAVSTPVQ